MNNRNLLLTAITPALNWLQAPKGAFFGVLRPYLPKPEASSGQWKMPLLPPVNQQNL